jgi:hypothetical protein
VARRVDPSPLPSWGDGHIKMILRTRLGDDPRHRQLLEDLLPYLNLDELDDKDSQWLIGQVMKIVDAYTDNVWQESTVMAAHEEDKLGQAHPCERCGHPGEWIIDPYREDLAGVRVLVALCRSCAIQDVQDV